MNKDQKYYLKDKQGRTHVFNYSVDCREALLQKDDDGTPRFHETKDIPVQERDIPTSPQRVPIEQVAPMKKRGRPQTIMPAPEEPKTESSDDDYVKEEGEE